MQKKEQTPVKNKVINSLLTNLDMSGAYVETFNKEEQLIIVPLRSGFVSNNNKGKDPINVLQLIEDKDHKIRSGQIIQFIPAQPGKYSHIPTVIFHNLFNSKKLDVEGTFTYLSIGDIFSYGFEFKNGELYAEKIIKHEAAITAGNTQRDGEYCTHWWILTTYICRWPYRI